MKKIGALTIGLEKLIQFRSTLLTFINEEQNQVKTPQNQPENILRVMSFLKFNFSFLFSFSFFLNFFKKIKIIQYFIKAGERKNLKLGQFNPEFESEGPLLLSPDDVLGLIRLEKALHQLLQNYFQIGFLKFTEIKFFSFSC